MPRTSESHSLTFDQHHTRGGQTVAELIPGTQATSLVPEQVKM